jgi:hypothetical protein
VTELPPVNARVFRIVASAWLLGWFWKAWFFVGYYFGEIWAHPLRYGALPRVLVHPIVASITWASPLLVLVAIVYPRAWLPRAASWLMAAASFVACLHIETFSDATFVTSFWVALWLVWFAANARRTDAAFYMHARVLAQCTVGLVFLAGAAGKLTMEYWSGDAFYQLYFIQKSGWPYSWLRESVAPDTLHVLAAWFSRSVIVVELALALNPLAPFRVAAIGGTLLLIGMVLISTLYLFSVMACLIGMLIALLFVPAERPVG